MRTICCQTPKTTWCSSGREELFRHFTVTWTDPERYGHCVSWCWENMRQRQKLNQASNCSVCCSKLHTASTDPQPKPIKHITKIKAISGATFLKASLRWNQIPPLSCKRGYTTSCQRTFHHRWWARSSRHLKHQNDSEAQWGSPQYQKQSVFRETAFQPPAQGHTTSPQRRPETCLQFVEGRAPKVADLSTDCDWQFQPRGPSTSPQRETVTYRGQSKKIIGWYLSQKQTLAPLILSAQLCFWPAFFLIFFFPTSIHSSSERHLSAVRVLSMRINILCSCSISFSIHLNP